MFSVVQIKEEIFALEFKEETKCFEIMEVSLTNLAYLFQLLYMNKAYDVDLHLSSQLMDYEC